ncbi:MAG: hypothetical protein K2G19_11040 [Lachnospiraceae bacterium]|nr:hypothetical protein [Lachnospiraceae bacterium]
MKKQIYLGMAVFAAAVMVFLGILTGRQFLSLVSGPKESAGVSLEQMEGQYITYSVARPVASFAEEYYSGDPDRVSRMAYVVYDQERQIFLKIVVPEQNKGKFNKLMQAVNRSPELKESWGDKQASGERPVEVAASLMPIEESGQVRQIEEALAGVDSYSTKEMNELAFSQSDWYVLEDKTIGGISVANLWICVVAEAMSFLVLLICLVFLTKKSDTDPEEGRAKDTVGQFLEKQKSWLVPWCEKSRKWQNGIMVLFLAGAMAALTFLGLFVGYTVQEVMTCHLPIGIILGELSTIVMLLGVRNSCNPDRILKKCRKNLEHELPGQAERERAARELMDTSQEWAVLEKDKEDVQYGMVGGHYWMVLTGKGGAVVAAADRVGKITSETVSGQMRSGKIRMNYTYYTVQISYMDSKKKKGADVVFNFEAEETAGHFMMLVRKRLGARASDIIK